MKTIILYSLFKYHLKQMSQPQYISTATNFSLIDCQKAFKSLNQKQSIYAYNFAKASWNGAKICFFQRSYQSPALLYILIKAFQNKSAHQVFNNAKVKISHDDLTKIFIYLSAFLDNCGNFKSFGDSKFIPECNPQNLKEFFMMSQYWSNNPNQFMNIYQRIQKYIFAFQKPYDLINFSNKEGTTGYYSSNCTLEDAEKLKNILIKKAIMSQNNRLIKISDNQYIVKIASQEQKQQSMEVDGIKINLKYGEFSNFLKSVNKYLNGALQNSANQNQRQMIKQYIDHFKTGCMQKHKQSQKWWIKDVQPVIQTNIGFIQSYLDPLRIRAQFQGFVAVVNKQQSILLTKLVDSAPATLQYLPWGKDFQVKQFKKPDFTSLQVLAFGSSGIPVGINIPNYHDIRQNFGFKNVNLGNAYGQPSAKSIQYTPQQEIQLHLKYYKQSLFVIVALHQLLGHGSGRLLDFKPDFKSPIDSSQLTTFYGPNQTWHSIFGQLASTYQQCRADSVALYLSLFEDVQQILLPNFTKEQRWDIVYVAWFDLIVGGLKGLQYFDVNGKKWLQAHIGASFAILKVLEQQGGIFQIKKTLRDGKDYLQIHLNKEAIRTKGKKAMGVFLQHLQVYKSTADNKRGIAFFNKYLEVNQQLLKYRETIMLNKRPRRLTVQSDVKLSEGKVQYVKFAPSAFGCIDSGISHYSQNVQDIILEWQKNNQEFRY